MFYGRWSKMQPIIESFIDKIMFLDERPIEDALEARPGSAREICRCVAAISRSYQHDELSDKCHSITDQTAIMQTHISQYTSYRGPSCSTPGKGHSPS